MIEEEESTQPFVAEGLGEAERGPQTPFEALRAKRDEVASRTTVLIPLGSAYTEMGVHAKYRLLDRTDTDEIAKKVRKQTKDRNEFMYRVIVDTMILACEGFYLKTPNLGDDDAEPLRDTNEKHVDSFAQFAFELRGEPFQ